MLFAFIKAKKLQLSAFAHGLCCCSFTPLIVTPQSQSLQPSDWQSLCQLNKSNQCEQASVREEPRVIVNHYSQRSDCSRKE